MHWLEITVLTFLAWQDVNFAIHVLSLEGTFILSFCKKNKKGYQKHMKQTLNISLIAFLLLLSLVCLSACQGGVDYDAIWENATYKEDVAFGIGQTELTVEVAVGDHLVTFTVFTDKTTVGAALLEHNLIAGDDGAYGLYVKTVNGMLADYDKDQSYWCFYVDGETAMTGVDLTEIVKGTVYRLAYTK